MSTTHRHFTYRTLDDIRAACAELGVDVTFEDALDAVARPVIIGDRTIGNALGIHPMEGCDAEADGSPGELTLRRWLRFAEGGAKLIWGEATAVVEEGKANARQLWLHDANTDAFARMCAQTRAAHRAACGRDDDLLVGLQLTHSGRWSHPAPILAAHLPAVDARTRDKRSGRMVDAGTPLITDDELARLQDAYVHAARLAARAGFDFVDIKQCHTYLLGELLCAHAREGRYGGGFANRTRFVREVVEGIRTDVPSLLVATRINAYDGIPYHADPETGIGVPDPIVRHYRDGFGVDAGDPATCDMTEPLALVRMLRAAGVALVNVSAGSPYYNPHIGRPYERASEGSYIAPEHPLTGVDRHFRLTAAVQEAFPGLAVMGTGYSWLQQFMVHAAESNIRRGRTTIAGVGRGALAYPHFVRDALGTGALDRRRVCLTVSFCTDLMRAKHNEAGQFPTGCVPRDDLYAAIYKDEERTKGGHE